MERENSAGIRRSDLLISLRTPAVVRASVRHDYCMICRRPRVNAAGLCDVCTSQLQGEELNLATRWMMGVGP